jgi:hypothetical protein
MASKKTLNAENLEALGAQRLAELLMDIAEGNAATKRRLRLELTAQEAPETVAPEVRKRLIQIARDLNNIIGIDNLPYQRDRQLSIRLGHDIRRDLRLLAAQFGCSGDPNNAPIRPVSHALIMAWPTDQSSQSISLIFVPSQRCSSMTNVRARTPTEVRHQARAAYPPLHSANQRLLKEGRERFMDVHEITVHRAADFACNGVNGASGLGRLVISWTCQKLGKPQVAA